MPAEKIGRLAMRIRVPTCWPARNTGDKEKPGDVDTDGRIVLGNCRIDGIFGGSHGGIGGEQVLPGISRRKPGMSSPTERDWE